MESLRETYPIIIGTTGTGATFWLNEYGLPWIGATCGILTIINLLIIIKRRLKK